VIASYAHLIQVFSIWVTFSKRQDESYMRQEDFKGISRREMVRIERGIIEHPHKETLLRISRKLGVSLNELSTY